MSLMPYASARQTSLILNSQRTRGRHSASFSLLIYQLMQSDWRRPAMGTGCVASPGNAQLSLKSSIFDTLLTLGSTQIDKLLEGWGHRAKEPFFVKQDIKTARAKLQPALQKRKAKLATRIAATCVPTAQGFGPDSYLPLKIKSMYGSFLPRFPAGASHCQQVRPLHTTDVLMTVTAVMPAS
jgi:hypothetical protein